MKLIKELDELLFCFYEQNDYWPSKLHISQNQLDDLKTKKEFLTTNYHKEQTGNYTYKGVDIEVGEGDFYFS